MPAVGYQYCEALWEAAVDGLINIDRWGIIKAFNPGAENLFGYTKDEVVGQNVSCLMPETEARHHDGHIQKYIDGGKANIIGIGREVTAKHRTGRLFPMHLSIGEAEIEGEPHFIGICHDLTDYRALETENNRLQNLYDTLAAQEKAMVLTLDRRFRVLTANPAAAERLGLDMPQLSTLTLQDLQGALFSPRMAQQIYRQLLTGSFTMSMFEIQHPGTGQPLWVSGEIKPLRNSKGEPVEYHAVIFDVTDRVLAEREAMYLATHDSLTGLWNRARLEEALQELPADQPLAILYIDLDRFGHINSNMGPARGDQLLRTLAARLSQYCGTTERLSRWSGDEFVVVLPDIQTTSEATARGHELLALISEPLELSTGWLSVSATIGFSLLPADAKSANAVLLNAQLAKTRGKQRGGHCVVPFDARREDGEHDRFQIEQQFRRALPLDDFEVWFQPKLALADRHVMGAEALLRWHHKSEGSISPALFIPIAERLNLCRDIGWFVLDEVIGQMRTRLNEGRALLPVAVNISARQFADPDFSGQLLARLTAADLSGHWLELEITETALVHDDKAIRVNTRELRQAGIGIAIDDFGSGYTSIRALAELEASVMKIDRKFVDPLNGQTGTSAERLVSAMIDMAHSMDMAVVAEGIETAQQQAQLLGLGCDVGQGFGLYRPMSGAAWHDLLETAQ